MSEYYWGEDYAKYQDVVDGIPGLKGVEPKAAEKILEKYADYKIDSIHVDAHTGDIAYPPPGGPDVGPLQDSIYKSSPVEDESHEFSDEEIGWLNQQEINTLDPMETQVGGDHYTGFAIQPWDIITAYELNFFEGSVLKYILRWRRKNGLEDLHKARHVLAKLISDVENSEEPPF